MTTLSSAEYRQSLTKAKPNKFKARPVVHDGIRFASKAEGNYYLALKLRERAGEVYDVELQKPYVLEKNGFKLGRYLADFSFYDAVEKRSRVIDVKGHDTPLSKWKRNHVRAQYLIEVEVVK